MSTERDGKIKVASTSYRIPLNFARITIMQLIQISEALKDEYTNKK